MYVIEPDPITGIPRPVPRRGGKNSAGQRERFSDRRRDRPSRSRRNGAPRFVPITQSGSSPSSSSSEMNVVDDFDWKVSPNNNLIEHPCIFLKEYRVKKGSLIAQVSYNAQAAVESGVTNFNSSIPDGQENSVLSKIRQAGGDIRSAVGLDPGVGPKEILEPYLGLYILERTRFTYKLPYFTTKHNVRTANWDESFSGTGSNAITNLLSQPIDFVATFGTGSPVFGALFEPGIYIERGKYYQAAPGADSITFSFPLLNTLNSESIQKNYDLLWLLFFQNSSFRKSKTEILPPCLYEVLVPGIKYMLHAYVSNITVEYLGTRRKISVANRGTGTSVDTIIPEAYNVRITINSLTTESGNFMLESLRDSL